MWLDITRIDNSHSLARRNQPDQYHRYDGLKILGNHAPHTPTLVLYAYGRTSLGWHP